MKNILLIIIVLMSSCTTQKKQEQNHLSIDENYYPKKLPSLVDTLCPPYRTLAEVTDTATYVKYNFEKRKACYLEKPLTVLLNELELSVKGYHDINPIGTQIVPETYLFFHDNATRLEKMKAREKMAILLISWKHPLDFNLTRDLFKRNPQWTGETINYYSQQKIGDISLLYK